MTRIHLWIAMAVALASGTMATAVGLAQLATDRRPSLQLPVGDSAVRGFGTVTLPLDEVRTVARRYGARVSDVLLASVAGGLRRALGARPPRTDRRRCGYPCRSWSASRVGPPRGT